MVLGFAVSRVRCEQRGGRAGGAPPAAVPHNILPIRSGGLLPSYPFLRSHPVPHAVLHPTLCACPGPEDGAALQKAAALTALVAAARGEGAGGVWAISWCRATAGPTRYLGANCPIRASARGESAARTARCWCRCLRLTARLSSCLYSRACPYFVLARALLRACLSSIVSWDVVRE
jgi:hypothetical protein